MASQKDINNQKQLNSEYAVTRDILVEVQKSLGKQRDATKEAASEYRKLESISQKLLLDEEQIVQLTDKQIQQNKDKAASALAGVKVQAQRLMTEKGIVDINHTQIGMIHNLTDAEKELLAAAKDGYNVEQDLVNKIEEELQVRDKSNKLLGVSGNILKGINAIAGNFSKAFGLDEVQEKMQKTADEVVRMNKSFGGLRVAAAGFGEAFNQLGNTLLSPTVLLTNMVVGFNKVDKAATDFQQQTGQDLNTMSTSLNQFNGGLITSAEYIKTASDLTKEFGLNAAAVFTPENLSEAASMTKEMGLAGKEAANLARLSKVNGGNIESQNESIVAGINSANKQNKTAVAHGQALRDVANASEGIAISYAGYPEKLGEAATAAAGLGMSLGDVDRIASSLLDFQSSIEAEMEAELLTGRSLNLEKARQLALDNDLAGVATELANQGITSANFSKMNRIQQEAQAKALGMSRDEMARMLLQQELNGGLSEDALNDAQKATLEDLKRVDAQEKIATAISKLQQVLAPIIGIIADIASNSIVIYTTMGVALLAKMPMLVKSAKGLASGFQDAYKNAKSLASGLKNMVIGGDKSSVGGGKAGGLVGKLKDKLTGKEGDSVGKVADKTKGIDPKQGSGVKEFLKGLGDGLASIGKQFGDVVKGGIALGLSLLAIGGGFALALPLIANTDPAKMLAFAASLSAIGLTVAVMGKVGSDIMKGALALGIMAVSLIPAAFAFSLLAGVDASSILAFSIALPILGLSVLGLGLIFTNPVTMFLFGAGVAGLLSLGLAILPLAGAFSMLKDVDVTSTMMSMTSGLGTLVALTPGLMGVSGGLFAIAGGLTAMSVAGIMALPVVGALTALGAVSEGLNSVFGGNSETESAGGENKGSMKAVEAKLDELIAVISAGGDVYIDGAKVGKTIALASSNLG